MTPYYEHGGIAIYNADWRACDLPKTFDLLLTDPPYGLNEAAGKSRVRKGNSVGKGLSGGNKVHAIDYGAYTWDEKPPSQEDVSAMREMGKLQCIFGGNYFALPPTRCWLVWDKVNTGDYADCELAWTNYPMAVRKLSYMWNGMLKAKPEARFHPTQKPLTVMIWALSKAGKGVRSVVDPYMGSGTTLVAAKSLGCTAVGCEREERYCEIAAERLRQEVLF